jgi:hypothetical protein
VLNFSITESLLQMIPTAEGACISDQFTRYSYNPSLRHCYRSSTNNNSYYAELSSVRSYDNIEALDTPGQLFYHLGNIPRLEERLNAHAIAFRFISLRTLLSGI